MFVVSYGLVPDVLSGILWFGVLCMSCLMVWCLII